jgi:hypothetical protein
MESVMGMEDRDWYREKEIDWDRGGLRDRNAKRRRFRKYTWWILAIILLIAAVILLRQV